ncbi:MAG: hypothetical protein AB1505_34920 [Candidatus Latescibacterota bacterium]
MVGTLALGLLAAGCRPGPRLDRADAAGALPRIDPDYTFLVIPPNIAPLNFRIREPGEEHVLRLSSDTAPLVQVRCPDGDCRMDPQAWRRLLQASRGRSLHHDVFVKQPDGRWVQFRRFSNEVAQEPIDSYIVYRRLAPNSQFTQIKGIFQRDLESFDVSALVTLRQGTFECVNCHTFHQNSPDRFLFHVRRKNAGTVFVMDGRIRKVDTRAGPMFRPMAYSAWHPDGHHVAATVNMYVGNSPSTATQYYFQAIEKRGDLVVFDVDHNTVSTTPSVYSNDYMETHPCWSADGRYIYFARQQDRPLLSHADLDSFRADLARISCDVTTNTWGTPETVMAYSEVGKSCAFPRPSPDGRYVLHILADKGTYPVYQKSSDVYLFDLASGQYRRLDAVNSDLAESFPRWSSNGRWFSFVSSRRDGRSAVPHFAYFDALGQAHKAFVLPEEDPSAHDSLTDTYNVVELVKSRIRIDPFALAQAMQEPAASASFPDPPEVDAYTGATRLATAGGVGAPDSAARELPYH